MEKLDAISLRHGGRIAGQGLYRFPRADRETARKTIEAADELHEQLRNLEKDIYGFTVLVMAEEADVEMRMNHLLFQISDESGFWVDGKIVEDFREYLTGETTDLLFKVTSITKTHPRLEERLPKLLVHPDRLKAVTRVLEWLDDSKHSVLVLRGVMGAGKRATLQEAFHRMYPDDGGEPIVLPFSLEAEDPMEPFLRSLGPFLESVPDFLNGEERIWWITEAADYLESCRKGTQWSRTRDQVSVDLVQAFVLYLRAYLESRRRMKRPAYLVIDGFDANAFALPWFRYVFKLFIDDGILNFILIKDSNDFGEELDFPGKKREIRFSPFRDHDWISQVKKATLDKVPDASVLESWSKYCGANLYRLFHCVLAREWGASSDSDPLEFLISTLDEKSFRILLLVSAAAGLTDRESLVSSSDDEEGRAHYDGLLSLGLIREDPDGRVRCLIDIPGFILETDADGPGETEKFGEFLYWRLEGDSPPDLFRLMRYLETWGPVEKAVAVLDRLLEHLLTTGRLRAVGLLLNKAPLSRHDLKPKVMESLQNILGAARLRYVLLSNDAKQAHALVRNGTISLIGTAGNFSDRFRLQCARYHYAIGKFNDAVTDSKEALFAFQKAGNHKGETHAHIELALSLLAGGKMRDALEHFGIARRIGAQVNDSWGLLRAGALEMVSQYLFGNISRAVRDGMEIREAAKKEGRRDIWMLTTHMAVRIAFEMGHYDKAERLAAEGRNVARFYKLNDEERVMSCWRNRILSAAGKAEKDLDFLQDLSSKREFYAFQAEAAFLNDERTEALRSIRLAAEEPLNTRRTQGEGTSWPDGFFPVEGRLADADGPLDVLGEWITAFAAYLEALEGKEEATQKLIRLAEREGLRYMRPFSYLYAFWLALVIPQHQRETRMRYMNMAFSDLQARAGRFDDNQTKHSWLTAGPWNKLLMDEAQRLKIL